MIMLNKKFSLSLSLSFITAYSVIAGRIEIPYDNYETICYDSFTNVC